MSAQKGELPTPSLLRNLTEALVDTIIRPNEVDVHNHFRGPTGATIVMDSNGGVDEKRGMKADSLKVEEAQEESPEQNNGAFRLYSCWSLAEGLTMHHRGQNRESTL